MNILVYDVAAEHGGAVTILNYYYQQHKSDKQNNYIYLLSNYRLEETENITVINVPEVKKSWIHRALFDCFGVKKIINDRKIDECLSLQNTVIPGFGGKQTIYIQNALPFSEYRFSLSEDKILWVYQNVIGRIIKHSAKKASKVIVQSEWMRQALCDYGIKKEKIVVSFPQVDIPERFSYAKQKPVKFLYPANGAKFKNHDLIISACEKLKAEGIEDYSVVFTICGTETDRLHQIRLKAESLELPVKWVGTIDRNELFSMYSESVLLYPSKLETVGLPLYEASAVGSPILASDCSYARNVVGEYRKCNFFNPDDSAELAELMKQEIVSEV